MELKIPPPVWMLAVAALMKAAALLLPAAGFAGAAWAAWPVALAGAAVIVAGGIAFRRHGTTVNPHTPHNSSRVVTDGIYRYSRNPMYLGMALLLAAWALWLGNAAAWLGIVLFVALINRYQIRPEERILAAKFGDDYHSYCRRTRRWL